MRPIRCGDLYWLDHDDGRAIDPAYSHPHVVTAVTASGSANLMAIEVCTVTTNLSLASEPGNMLLDKGEGGLLRRSVIVVSRVSTVSVERLRDFIGSLSEERVRQILVGRQFIARSFIHR